MRCDVVRAVPPSARLDCAAIIPFSTTTTVKSLIFWSAAALLVFGQTMILRAWWAGRTPAAAATRRPRASEFVWIALPVLALSATLAFTWRALSARPNESHVHAESAP